MELLGLSSPRPITFAEAQEVIDADGHGGPDDPDHLSRVFVTPEVDGWTLVMGAWCDPCGGERREDVLRLCRALSARYGGAQAYYFGAQGDGSAWLIAENGCVIRRYAATGESDDESLTLGNPLPYEQVRLLELGLPADGDLRTASGEQLDEWTVAAFDLAPEIAAACGISPFALTHDTKVRGIGLLAMTPEGVGRAAEGMDGSNKSPSR
jgi:hypothetical protein